MDDTIDISIRLDLILWADSVFSDKMTRDVVGMLIRDMDNNIFHVKWCLAFGLIETAIIAHPPKVTLSGWQ